VHAAGLIFGQGDFVGVVASEKRTDDELAGLDGGDFSANLLDDTDILMTIGTGPSTVSMPR
jgi:hypothetical protein